MFRYDSLELGGSSYISGCMVYQWTTYGQIMIWKVLGSGSSGTFGPSNPYQWLSSSTTTPPAQSTALTVTSQQPPRTVSLNGNPAFSFTIPLLLSSLSSSSWLPSVGGELNTLYHMAMTLSQ